MLIDAVQKMQKTKAKKLYDDDSDDDGGYNSFDGKSNKKDSSKEVNMDSEDTSKLKGFNDLTASMADYDRGNTSLCELPYHVTRDLMRSMDTDKGWEALAVEADFTFDRIQLLALKQQQADGSPTKTLLWDLGCQGYRVTDLYDKLKNANRLREMQILETYVRAAGQESKKVDPPLRVSLSQRIKQLQMQEQEKSMAESGFSSPGSELNFNHQSLPEKSKAKVTSSKHYDDKVIPGTETPSLKTGLSSLSRPSLPSFGQGNPSLNGSKPIYSYSSPLQFKTLTSSLGSKTAVPPSLPTSMNGSTGRSNGFPSGGAGNIQRMLQNVTLPSGTGSAATTPLQSIRKSSLESSASSTQENASTSPATQPNSNLMSFSSLQSEADVALSVKGTYSYKDLQTATDGFKEGNILGQGAFGTVYLGFLIHGDCAIKRLEVTATNTPEKLNQVKSELAILLKYQHENIVTPYGFALDGPEICLVYQYLVNGSLEDRLCCKNSTPPLTWERRLNILRGASRGLNFLHTKGDPPLIHGDIKSANILLDQYFEAKIADLGQAKYATSPSTDSTGFTHITRAESSTKLFFTKAYQPPEFLSSGAMSLKSDIYAMGVVILEVCSGLQAHDPNRSYQFLAELFNQDIIEKDAKQWAVEFQDHNLTNVPENNFVDVLKLAKKCVNRVKKQRPTSEKLRKEMDSLYIILRELMGGDYSSITSSLEMSSPGSESSRSAYQSHKSFPPEDEVMSSTAMPYQLQHQEEIQALQEQRLQHFTSTFCGTHNSRPQPQSKPQFSLPPQGLIGSHSDDSTDAVEMRKSPYSDPDSPFPNNMPLPESFRLQRLYDSQQEKKRIERLSALSQTEESGVEEYQSDPVKLQKILDDDRDFKSMPPTQATSIAEENIPESDPKKLALLMGGYDDTRSHPSSTITSGKCESNSARLAVLQNLDDSVYNNPKQSPQKVCPQYPSSNPELLNKSICGTMTEAQQSTSINITGGHPVSITKPTSLASSNLNQPSQYSQFPQLDNGNFPMNEMSFTNRRPSNDSNVQVPESESFPASTISKNWDNVDDGRSNQQEEQSKKPSDTTSVCFVRRTDFFMKYEMEKGNHESCDYEEDDSLDNDIIEESEPQL